MIKTDDKIETEHLVPPHERLKKDLTEKFVNTSTYLGSHIKRTIMDSDFKILKQNSQPPHFIKKGDVIRMYQGSKPRPCVVTKVLKDRTVLFIPLTSTENIHCMTPFYSRFFGEGCFCKNFDMCAEEKAIENFIGCFDNMKALNQAIKDLRIFFINNF